VSPLFDPFDSYYTRCTSGSSEPRTLKPRLARVCEKHAAHEQLCLQYETEQVVGNTVAVHIVRNAFQVG
jgi:hypothetical protein